MANLNKKKRLTTAPGMASVYTAFIGAIVLMVIFTLVNKNFASKNNLMSLSRSICPYLLVGVGQGIVCITGNIDLSIGSVLGMSSMITATLICKGVNPILALLLNLIACLCVGVINGILVGKCGLPSFIGTLGTMTIGRGVAEIVNGNYNTGDIGTAPLVSAIRNLFYYGKLGVIYESLILTLVIWFAFNYVMNRTKIGRHIYALGGSGCLVGVIAGASIWAILQNGLTLAGVPVAIRNIVIGLIVVACVLADIMRRGGRKSK